jgi:hypothetical protein
VLRAARERGVDKSTLTVQDYRFFQSGEAEEVCRLLKGKSVYIEISRGQERVWEEPVIRQALIEDIRPLAQAGVQFTVSTDAMDFLGEAQRLSARRENAS